MSRNPSNLPELRSAPATGPVTIAERGTVVARASPSRQLADMPTDELAALAEELGLEPVRFEDKPSLVAAVHDRRQMIAAMDRAAMVDVVRWGRRPALDTAGNEQLAMEIVRIQSMRFAGLSQRGLVVLARLRGVEASDADPVPTLVKRLKKQETFFKKFNRKRRAWLGGIVSNMLGDDTANTPAIALPPPPADPRAAPNRPAAASSASLKEDIEESGLFGGIANRVKKTADAYLNQKLDEIEARLDRKLDEIDRRLGDWRDKEIANRIRILKITLWTSVIVGAFSLLYAYAKAYFFPR